MKYYYIFLKEEGLDYEPLVSNKDKMYGLESDYEFQKCKKIKWDKRNTLYYDKEGFPEDYLANTIFAPVVSQKIKNILEKELKVNGLQFFPVPIKHTQSDKVIQGYSVMNVLNLIKDAVDREKSLISQLGTVIKYTLKEQKLKSQDVFRLDDGSGLFVSLFVSDRVKQAFDKAGVTGIAYGGVRLS